MVFTNYQDSRMDERTDGQFGNILPLEPTKPS